MAAVAPDLCVPWIGTTEVKAAGSKYASLSDAQIAPLLMPASELCYKLSGREFPGVCPVTDLRPCLAPGNWGQLPHNFTEAVLWYGACGCGGEPWLGCECSDGIYSLDLSPYTPTSISQISEVRIDGAVFDPSKYTVLDRQTLARTDGQSWPLSQRFDRASTEVLTWAIDFEYGIPPPEDAQLACAMLVGEMVLSLFPDSGECSLPARVQSVVRQGISYVITDPLTYIGEGKTGILLVDIWLTATNPSGGRGGATLSYPGKPGLPGRRRT